MAAGQVTTEDPARLGFGRQMLAFDAQLELRCPEYVHQCLFVYQGHRANGPTWEWPIPEAEGLRVMPCTVPSQLQAEETYMNRIRRLAGLPFDWKASRRDGERDMELLAHNQIVSLPHRHVVSLVQVAEMEPMDAFQFKQWLAHTKLLKCSCCYRTARLSAQKAYLAESCARTKTVFHRPGRRMRGKRPVEQVALPDGSRRRVQ